MIKYVKKDNGLYWIKKSAIGIAKDFSYGEAVIVEIQNAKSEYQIERILTTARKAQK